MSQDISTELLYELIAITSGADNDKPRAPAKMIDLNSALLELKRRRDAPPAGYTARWAMEKIAYLSSLETERKDIREALLDLVTIIDANCLEQAKGQLRGMAHDLEFPPNADIFAPKES